MQDHTKNHPCSMETFAKAHPYREAAISLNNMGVSLFERLCCEEALEAFENGIRVVCSCQLERNRLKKGEPITRYLSKGDQRSLLLAEVEHKVYRTSLHLSSDAEAEDPPPLLPLPIDEDDSSWSQDEDFLSGVHICNQYGEAMNISSPARREGRECARLVYYQQYCPLPSENNTDTTSPRTLLATLLYNRGQVYRYKVALTRYSSPHASEQNLDRALESFFLAREASLLSMKRPKQPLSRQPTKSTHLMFRPTIPSEQSAMVAPICSRTSPAAA